MNQIPRCLGTSLLLLAAFAAPSAVRGQEMAPVISRQQAIDQLGEASRRSRDGFNDSGSALEAISQRPGARRPGGRVPTPARRPDVFVQPIVPTPIGPMPELRPPGRSRATLEVRPTLPESPAAPYASNDANTILEVIPNTDAEAARPGENVPENVLTSPPTPAIYGIEDFERLEKHFDKQHEREQQHLEAIQSSLSTLSDALRQMRRKNSHAAQDSSKMPASPGAHAYDPPSHNPEIPPNSSSVSPLPQPPESPLAPVDRAELGRNPPDVPIEIGIPPSPPLIGRRNNDTTLPEPAPVYPIEPSPTPAMSSSPPLPATGDAPLPPEQPAPSPDSLPTGTLATNEAVDRVALADSLYASKQLPLALQMYRELAPSEKGEERVWINYQIANCLRQLDEHTEAEAMYRTVAAESSPEWVVDSSRWWLSNLESQASLRSKLNAVAKQLDEQ